jgi:hypothetical protein
MTLPNKIGYDVHSIAEKKKLAAEQQKQVLLQQQVILLVDRTNVSSINMR